MKLSMVGRLSQCLLLAYRTPADSVRSLLPRGLELVTHGPWAFWNVVVCRVEKMRPAGLPRWTGLSYHHVAYRLYVRATTAAGEQVQGLYFLRSDADRAAIAWGGNLASDFHFHRASICVAGSDTGMDIGVTGTRGGEGDAMLRVRTCDVQPALAADSCFSDLPHARETLKYRPIGLATTPNGRWLRYAEVFRDETQWRETPVAVEAARWSYFDAIGQEKVALELATQVAPLEYRWRLGGRELLPVAGVSGVAGRPA